MDRYLGLFNLFKGKLYPPSDPVKDPNVSISGNIVIITGANTGLGYEAAIKFAHLKVAKLILGCRSLEKGNAAKASIVKLSPIDSFRVDVWELDMASYDSIRAFIEKCNKLRKIDIVILNAAVMMNRFEQSQYGWETTFQVNTLSTILLAILLLPKFQEVKEAHERTPVLEFVSSELYAKVFVPHADEPMQSYNTEENFSGKAQYARSKFFLQCAIKSLIKIAGNPLLHDIERDVAIRSVSPGLCSTNLGREGPVSPLREFLYTIGRLLFARTAEQGARSIVSGALIQRVARETQGGYWRNDAWQELAENVQDHDLNRNVWVEIVRALGKDLPEIYGIIDGQAQHSASKSMVSLGARYL